jgi:hypothetical protein
LIRRLFAVTVLLLLFSFTVHEVIVTGPDLYGKVCAGSGWAEAVAAARVVAAAKATPVKAFLKLILR